MTADDVIDGVIAREGGFVHHKADKGGATNFGITAATLGASRKLGRAATPEEVQALTVTEAHDIYFRQYVFEPGFDAVPEGLLAQVVDDAVLSGPATAVKALQRAIGVPPDGVIGPATRAALKALDVSGVQKALVKDRAIRLARIVKNDPSQSVFIEGWIRRALEFL